MSFMQTFASKSAGVIHLLSLLHLNLNHAVHPQWTKVEDIIINYYLCRNITFNLIHYGNKMYLMAQEIQ